MANTRDTIGDQATVDGLVNHTLTSLEEDGISAVGNYALYNNTALTSVNFPNATSLGEYAMAGCTGLTSLAFPKVNTIGSYTFSNDTNLTDVSLTGSGTKTIYGYAFNGCTKLKHLVIGSSSMSTLISTNAFVGTPISRKEGAIYVPTALINTYKSNTNWSNYFITDMANYPLSDFSTISDSWATIIANSNYDTDYSIGDTKTIDLGAQGTHLMVLVAKNTDNKADGTGKARMTWVSNTILTTRHLMNSTATTTGGWADCSMRSYLTDTIKPLIPETIRNAIVPVTKVSSTYESSAIVPNGQTTTDDVWIPSAQEIFGGSLYETDGVTYTTYFNSATARTKYLNGSTSLWWLRSASSTTKFRDVASNGNVTNDNASGTSGVVLGFCI